MASCMHRQINGSGIVSYILNKVGRISKRFQIPGGTEHRYIIFEQIQMSKATVESNC